MTSVSSSFQAFIFGGLCTLALAWLSSTGALHWINLKIHDQALSWASAPWSTSTTVIINNDLNLEIGFEKELKQLLATITEHNASHIVLLTQVAQIARETRGYLSDLKWPVYLATPQNMSDLGLGKKNSQLKHLELFNIKTVQGMSRKFELSSSTFSLFSLYGNNENLTGSEYYFNHFININTLPNITLSHALKGGIIDELVADKIVIVDLDYSQYPATFYTPGSSSSSSATLAQIQALAAETLLTKSYIRSPSALLSMLVLLIIYTLCFFLLQLLSSKGVFIFGLALTMLTFFGAVATLFYWHTLLPIFEWIVIQVFCVVYLLSIERLREESLILQMSAALNARLGKRVQPPSFYQSEQPWDNLHTMINQQLNLQRSIFLAKVPKDHRVVAIHGLNCAIDDIKEKRRDFKRSPYSLALASLKPLKLEKQYFKQLADNEVEYLCPLFLGGRMLGFWALTVVPGKDWHGQTFENHLNQFSTEITELLHHRENYLHENRKQNHIIRRIFGLKLAQAEYQDLDTSVSRLEKRFDSLQTIYDGMSTASSLYSLFGQIVYSNRQMEALIKKWNLPFYTLSAHDFLLQITDLDSQQIKQRLLQVTLNNVEVCLNIDNENKENHYILRIRPMQVPNDNKEQGAPFLLLGLLFEFIDIGEAQHLMTLKKDLYTQYFHQMRNNLGELYLVSRQLQQQLPDKNPLLNMLTQTLDECTKVNLNIEEQLASHRSLVSNVVPVNPCSEWQKVVNINGENIRKKRIQLAEDLPAIMSLVLAEQSQLCLLLELICVLLVEDSDSNESTLSLLVKDTYQLDKNNKQKRIITMRFSNEGYGVPESQLKELTEMSVEQLGHDEVLEKLLIAANSAASWGLELEINSKLGSGYVIELSMPVFLMN